MSPRPTSRRRPALAIALGALLVLARAAGAQPAARPQAPAERTLRITAALVGADLTVKPVPLHALEIVSAADSTRRIAARTALDGTLAQPLAAGRWRVRSAAPVPLADSAYAWDVTVEVGAADVALELTNANAAVSPRAGGVASGARAARQVAPEREVFERIKRGVVRVEAGLGHGSGFLVGEHGGLVVTNDHVVANTSEASIYLDSLTRVPAQVVVRDREADLALLRIPAGRCGACPRLPIARPPAGEALVLAGERILAVGFPLNQEMTLTTGIVSSVRDGAIISDVNINHGNSGGPMLNLAGEVVGVNAFGDFTSQGGPGISGAIAIHRLAPLLERVPAALAALPALEDRALPVLPREVYPLPLLKSIADTATLQQYRHFAGRGAGRFTVSVSTPVQQFVLLKAQEDEMGKERKRREQRANISDEERYSDMKEARDWFEYVGNPAAPVIALTVNPKIGETGGSLFARALMTGLAGAQAGAAMKATYKFQGDVRGVRLYRNGVEVEPLRGGHAPQKVLIDNQWVALKDVADMGYYVYAPEAFAPDSTGAPARVTIVVQDLKNPESLSTVDYWGETSARIWNDFLPFFALQRPEGAPRAANPKLPSPKVPLDCAPQTGTCARR